MQGGVDGFHRVGKRVLQRVDELVLCLSVEHVDTQGLQARCDVALAFHKRHEHVLVGQFLSVALGYEAVDHVVVLYGRVGADGLEATVVIGEDEAVGRNHDARAIAREVDDIVLDGIGVAVECRLRQCKAVALHGFIHLCGQVVECPHAFVGHCLEGCCRKQ